VTNYQPFPTRRNNWLPTLVAGAAFVLAAFLVIERTGWLTPGPNTEAHAIEPRGELAPLEEAFIEVFQKCSPSVAHINTSSLMRTYRGVREQTGSGSGFVWDTAGVIVTNHHVIENAQEVTVTLAGGNYRADVVASSPPHDLAILRLRGRPNGLVPLLLGTSDDLQVGQTAIAIGNPFGFDLTMTTGVVSALNRTLQTKNELLMHGLIQVDAAINPGNSGGPLLDSAGRLIGVTTAIYSPSGANAGLGFAVPVDLVNEIVPRLLSGRQTRAVLGVRNSTEYGSLRLSPDLGVSSGAIFTEVVEGYGAAQTGLVPFKVRQTRGGGTVESYGDVIVAIDNKAVRSFSDLSRVLGNRTPGDKVRVRVIRGLPDAPRQIDIMVSLAAQGEGVASDI